MEKMKQTRTRYHNQGLYLVISCINLLMLPCLCLFPWPLLIVLCISLLVGGVLLLISYLSFILLRKVGEGMEGGQNLVCPWMLVREEYCIILEKHVNRSVLLRRNAWSWSILMCHKKLQSSHSYNCFCNTFTLCLSFRWIVCSSVFYDAALTWSAWSGVLRNKSQCWKEILKYHYHYSFKPSRILDWGKIFNLSFIFILRTYNLKANGQLILSSCFYFLCVYHVLFSPHCH